MARAAITTTAPMMGTGEVEGVSASVQSLLYAWFSPACPIGAFSYSHGLERLCEDGAVRDKESAHAAIEAALVVGSGWSDAVLMCAAYEAAGRGDGDAFSHVAALGLALSPSRERREETARQGSAFATLCTEVWPGAAVLEGHDDVPLPVAVGAVGAAHGVPQPALVHGLLSAFAANLVSAAVRLVPLGQTDGQRLTRDLAPTVARTAEAALSASLMDVGGFAPGLDAASMRHETQYVRLFRS